MSDATDGQDGYGEEDLRRTRWAEGVWIDLGEYGSWCLPPARIVASMNDVGFLWEIGGQADADFSNTYRMIADHAAKKRRADHAERFRRSVAGLLLEWNYKLTGVEAIRLTSPPEADGRAAIEQAVQDNYLTPACAAAGRVIATDKGAFRMN